MKLFTLQTDLTSYTYPIVKIVICVLIVAFSIMRRSIINFSAQWVDIVVTVLCLILSVMSILCVYISVGELFYVYKKRCK